MQVLDPIGSPSGRETVTLAPVWRVRLDDGATVWAYVVQTEGRLWVTGYPRHPVQRVPRPPRDDANVIAGVGAGALIGAAMGGPAGALIGGLLGGLFGSGTRRS